MIAADQPTIFPSGQIRVVMSSVDDGSMKDGVDLLTPDAQKNRTAFLSRHHLPVDQTAIFAASFDSSNYCRYQEAQPGIHIGVDALVTNVTGLPILLPLADCTGAVLYDPVHRALMVSHLGRHSTEQLGAKKSVNFMQDRFDTDLSTLLVWLSPSPNGKDYPLWAFDNRSFTDVLSEQLVAAGVATQHIEINPIDTASHPNYFSHSQYLQGKQAVDGRYAIVAILEE
jgi:copper oxidase (laccase) domain-containing protein